MIIADAARKVCARLEELGVKTCLFKPVQPGELDGAIQSVLAGA